MSTDNNSLERNGSMMHINSDEYALLHKSSGEFKDLEIGSTVLSPKQKEVIKKKSEIQQEQKEFRKYQKESLGNFVFFLYQHIDDLQEKLGDNDLVKYMYIGTFVKKDGILQKDDNRTNISKRQLKRMLDLVKSDFYKFYNKLIENNLIYEKDDNLYINVNYFYRGTIAQYEKLSQQKIEEFTRMYTKTTRDMYENTTKRQHKRVAIAYKLLPYTHWKYNILCRNPLELEKGKLDMLTIRDVMQYLGYGMTNTTRFKRDFYGIKCYDSTIFASVQKNVDYADSTIIVNPHVFYRGNNIEELQGLLALFKNE